MTNTRTHQQNMQAMLKGLGIPFVDVHCYGSQIVITSLCEETANKWASVVSKFATVRGIRKSLSDNKVNKNTVMNPSHRYVWNMFAVM